MDVRGDWDRKRLAKRTASGPQSAGARVTYSLPAAERSDSSASERNGSAIRQPRLTNPCDETLEAELSQPACTARGVVMRTGSAGNAEAARLLGSSFRWSSM